MPISQINTNSIATGAVSAADLAAGAARANFGAGAVLQVVNATYSVQTDFTTTSYVDTGLTATITPSSASSKILVIVFQASLWKQTNAVYAELQLLRASTALFRFEGEFGQNGSNSFGAGSAGTVYLDSPATTSSVSYKTQCYSSGATIQLQRNSGVSTICLMEIAG
jgi:hypothetical protein